MGKHVDGGHDRVLREFTDYARIGRKVLFTMKGQQAYIGLHSGEVL